MVTFKELIAFIILGGVIFLIAFTFLVCYYQKPNEDLEEEREEAKYRHWDED